jgi:hypothetical protein
MKRNFTVRQGALDGVEAFLSVARHRSFRKAAAELGVIPSAMSQTRWRILLPQTERAGWKRNPPNLHGGAIRYAILASAERDRDIKRRQLQAVLMQ